MGTPALVEGVNLASLNSTPSSGSAFALGKIEPLEID